MLDLEPPKPTKEFHEAYMEIYGKGKKKDDKAVQPADESISFSALDVPPPRTEEPKKSFFSFLNKEKKSSLDTLDLPPFKTDMPRKPLFSFTEKDLDIHALELPPLKISKYSSSKKSSSIDLFDLNQLDLPPLKTEPAPLPSLFQNIPVLEKKKIKFPVKEIEIVGKKAPVYDFLAEVKNGKRQAIEPIKKQEPVKKVESAKKNFEPAPISKEILIFNESVFEKTAAQKGARDMQIAFEHEPFEAEKPSSPNKSLFSFEESGEELPKVKPFKSPVEFKQYMKQAKIYEQKLKKLNSQSKKAQQEKLKKLNSQSKKVQQDVAALVSKQHSHDAKLNEKMKKISILEKELQEKHEKNVKKVSLMEQGIQQKEEKFSHYEPLMQELYMREDGIKVREDSIKTKEHEVRQKQQDLLDTEARLKAEENSIIAKIKRLEADQKILEKEQNAIVKSVQKLEEDKKQIVVKTREFADIMKRITLAETELKERTNLFVERENRIKRKEQLVEKEVARLATLKKKSEKLKDVEQTYERMKQRLRDAYEEYEQRFASKESYTPQKFTIEPTVKLMEEKPISQADTGDISNLISHTRKLVLEKKYEEASRNITKLMHRYMQIPDSNPRKKEIYYEILSIKNMLKLDLLD